MNTLEGVPEFSATAWVLSVAAVVACGLTAWVEGNWWRHHALDIGFGNHGGMWGDLLLLPLCNALIVPHLPIGVWLAAPVGLAATISLWLHAGWHGRHLVAVRDHMWPVRRHGRWFRDLSLAGWLHVLYVTGELGLIAAWAFSPMPGAVVWLVACLLSLHVPIGLLQPGWFATGHRPVPATPLLLWSLALLWATVLIKTVSFSFASSWPS